MCIGEDLSAVFVFSVPVSLRSFSVLLNTFAVDTQSLDYGGWVMAFLIGTEKVLDRLD